MAGSARGSSGNRNRQNNAASSRPGAKTAVEPETEAPVANASVAENPVQSQNGASSRWGTWGRMPIILLAGVAFIDAVDRGILPGVLPVVQRELGFTDTQAGFLATAFVLAGFLIVLPAGYLADRYTRTKIIGVVLASWGLISALNATVRNLWQFLAVRATLGIAETVDNPGASSLVADYYPAKLRGRAYAIQGMAPVLGTAIGTAVGGVLAANFGWRPAFLIVGAPGSLLALAVWRMREPVRGESDIASATARTQLKKAKPRAGSMADEPSTEKRGRMAAARDLLNDSRAAARVRTLRGLMIGSAISQGATGGFAFWAVAFYERHTTLELTGASTTVGALILLGVLIGTYVGGQITDRTRNRLDGAPMVVAGLSQAISAVVFAISFLGIPVWLMMLGHVVAIIFLVGANPALRAMTAEVVPAGMRGISFSITAFLGQLGGAISPLFLGLVADRFPITIAGEVKGNLQIAFLALTPLILIGGLVLLWSRRHVKEDTARAAETLQSLYGEEATT